MKLLHYEFKKQQTTFHILVVLILLIANFGVCLYTTIHSLPTHPKEIITIQDTLLQMYESDRSAYDELYQFYKKACEDYESQYYMSMYHGENQSIPVFQNSIIDHSDYGDRNLFTDLEAVIHAPTAYRSAIQTLLRDAAIRINEMNAASEQDTLTYRYYHALIAQYDKFYDRTFPISPVRGWDIYFSNNTTSIFLLIAIAVLFCDLFPKEQKCGITPLLHISKNGGIPLAAAKLGCAVFSSAFLTVLFSIIPLLIAYIITGLSDPNVCVQAISDYIYCPYDITIFECFLLNLGFRILLYSMLSLAVTGIGQCTRNEIPAFLFSIAVLLSGKILENVHTTSKAANIQRFGFFALANGNPLFLRYSYLNFFGYPVNFTVFAVGLILILIPLLILVSILFHQFTSHNKNSSKTRKKADVKKQQFSLSVCRVEWQKLMMNGSLMVLLSVIMMKCLISWFWYQPSMGTTEMLYRAYIQNVEGAVTEEKLSYITKESEYIQKSLDEYGEAETKYKNGDISYEEYQRYQNRYHYAQYYKNACERLCERRDYLLSVRETYPDIGFVDEEGLLCHVQAFPDIAMILAVVFLFGSLFPMEYESGFSAILRLSKNGRMPVFRSKYTIALSLTALLYLAFSGIDFVCLQMRFSPVFWNENVMSIPAIAADGIALRVWQYVLIYKLLSFIGTILCVLLLISMSIVFEKQFYTLTAWILAVGVPYIAEIYHLPFFHAVSILSAMSPGSIIQGVTSCVICGIIITVLTIAAKRKWNGRKMKYAAMPE